MTKEFPVLSKITREILQQLLLQALAETHGAHDLIWYYTTKYSEGGSPLEEINALLFWLGAHDEQASELRPVLCETSGKILAKTDGKAIYLWCRRHDCWEAKTLQNLF